MDDDWRMGRRGETAKRWRASANSARTPPVFAGFQYDSIGRRTGKTIASQTTGYLYDWENAVQELAGTSNASSVKAHLLTGGIDDVFLRLEGNNGTSRQSVLSASAGFGDAITFGFTRWVRKKLGIDGVDTCSGWYTVGEVAGDIVLAGATLGIGTEAEAGAEAVEVLTEEGAELEGVAADGAEQAPKAVERAIKEAQRELKQNKNFRRWFHKEFKAGEGISDGISDNLDLTGEQVLDAFLEWVESGRPTVK